MDYITSLLLWVIASWLFWPITVGIFLGCYLWVDTINTHRNKISFWSIVLLLLATALVIHRFNLTNWVTSNFNWLYIIGGYVAMGFIVSLYKWFQDIIQFKEKAKELTIRVDKEYPDYDAIVKRTAFHKLLSSYYGSSLTTAENGKLFLTPDRRQITFWWTYWPYFIFSVVLDPIGRAIKALGSLFSKVYTRLSQSFSV